jgi:hypothetical protein
MGLLHQQEPAVNMSKKPTVSTEVRVEHLKKYDSLQLALLLKSLLSQQPQKQNKKNGNN